MCVSKVENHADVSSVVVVALHFIDALLGLIILRPKAAALRCCRSKSQEIALLWGLVQQINAVSVWGVLLVLAFTL